jgi:histidine ammonia-lyase
VLLDEARARAAGDVERAAREKPPFSVNTGFGKLATTHIPATALATLQQNLSVCIVGGRRYPRTSCASSSH